MINLLELYAGIRGFSLAFEQEGFTTIGVSEIDPVKNVVGDHWYNGVPNYGNIRDPNFVERVRAAGKPVHVITGGIPCQPASALGQMRGVEDERWLWPETIGLVEQLRPWFAVFENPPSLLVLDDGRAWNGIMSAVVSIGYDCWWDVLPAAAVGAGHLRERLVIVLTDRDLERRIKEGKRLLAGQPQRQGELERGRFVTEEGNEENASNSKGIGKRITPDQTHAVTNGGQSRPVASSNGVGEAVTHANDEGLQGHTGNGTNGDQPGRIQPRPNRPITAPDLRGRVDSDQWWFETHTGIPVVADGLSGELVESAARCAGDAIVPQAWRPIARAIRKVIDQLQNSA